MRTKPFKWQTRYLNVAKECASWSKDPGSKVGAVVVGKDGQVLSQGYNGFPRGIRDLPERLNDRETKLKYTVHAEMNAILNASLTGTSLRDGTIYVYGLPTCSECAKAVIQSGIKTVVVVASDIDKSETWTKSWALSSSMFKEVGINIVEAEYE